MKRRDLLIGVLVGLVLGVLYYWLIWNKIICDWFFGIELSTKHWYFLLLSILSVTGFSINFGFQFGFNNREFFYNLMYIVGSTLYTTLILALLALIIWIVTHPIIIVLLIIGLIAAIVTPTTALVILICNA